MPPHESASFFEELYVPKFEKSRPAVVIGVVKITSNTKWPSGVTSGFSPPNGPASPKLGLLQTCPTEIKILN